ncbi:MAG TPA: cytochrome c oxidase assembly protein [Stellaceae bacterium]|nr:cytochrome c oxidase assembly protein [Stellaceae bacterium]
MRALIATTALLPAAAGTASAHAIAAGLHRSVQWSWEPWVVASLALAALWYAAGFCRLYRRLGPARVLRGREIAAFAAGWATIFIALLSPIDSISDQLFCIHMLQHLLLMLVAAPLLVLGRPALAFLWAFPPNGRKRIGRAWMALGLHAGVRTLMHPVLVWLLFYGTFIFWHFPGPYQAALRNEAIHAGEHLSFVVTALMFWSIVIEPSGRRRLGYGLTLLFVVKTAVLSALPGALLSLSQRPLYPFYTDGAAAWGLTLLQDQQLAGVVMWIPGGFVYVLTAALVFVKWLEEAEHRERARARLQWSKETEHRKPAPAPLRRAALPAMALFLLPLLLGVGSESRAQDGAPGAIGNADHGASLITTYGCGSCHSVPGVRDADGLVGPPLGGFGSRIYIAGILRNTPDNLVAWIRDPQHFVPGVVMPDMGVTEPDARDIAAYLEGLR